MAGRKRKNRFEFLTRKFPVRMQRKLVMLFMAVILAFVVLIGRITYINVTKGSKYTKKVLDQQNYGSRVIPYKRGDIVDRNGTKIATSERVYNVILDVKVMTDKDKYIEPTIQVLKDCFGIDEAQIRDLISTNPESRYSIVKKGIDYAAAKKFNEIDADDENYPNVKGIWLEDDYTRLYPYNRLASSTIGFTNSEGEGSFGIENAYNAVLSGTDGREYGYFDSGSSSSAEHTVKAAKNGDTVVTTIDVSLQKIVEDKILAFNQAHAGEARRGEPGSKNTAVMIMNPNTGEILAQASYPDYDLNNPADLSAIYSEDTINGMTEEEKTEKRNQMWRNFCISDTYEPGSTMKPFTVAAGLESGTLTGNETYYCGGSLRVADYDIGCHLRSGHGMETIQDAIANSCNVALMTMAESIGVDHFTRYQHIFGFGEYTGIDLPGEAGTAGLLYTADNMTAVDLATNSFGQSFNVTMVQLITGFSSLINGGYYYEPHVVKQIQDQNGNVIETKDPVLLRKTVSAETSTMLKSYMKATMEYGTGKKAAVEGYDIGAKTGTAQKIPRKEGKYLLSYIGYAPQENPEVVVYVVIDEPNVSAQDNSLLVLELAKSIMEEAFPYLGITTIQESEQIKAADAAAAAQAEGKDFGDTEYSDFDENYTDTYDKKTDSSADENYKPDLDSWATVNNGD